MPPSRATRDAPALTDRFLAAVRLANVLHDAAEDAGGREVLDRIRDQFGDRVELLVEALSDTLDPHDKRSWRARKAAYLAHLPGVTDDAVLRIALADKV